MRLIIPICLLAAACASPLVRAAGEGQVEQIRALVDRDKVHCGDALRLAAANNKVPAINVLLEAGCEVNNQDVDGYSPIMLAAQAGHDEAVQALLNARADVDLKTWSNKTASKLAREHGHKKTAAMIEMFIPPPAGVDAKPPPPPQAAGPQSTEAEKLDAWLLQLFRATKSIDKPGEKHRQAEAASRLIKIGAPAVPGLLAAAAGKPVDVDGDHKLKGKDIRTIAILVLGLIGPPAADAVPALTKALSDKDLHDPAADALARIRTK